MTFEEWSELFDVLFEREEYHLLLIHTAKSYQRRWNFGKD